jgi:TRAP-type uncharacterized transport system fused permease subunit
MITSLVLGMGLPTAAAYMVLAALVAPAIIISMGVPPMATHLFILYFGALSTITPPVALSTFAAAGIAGAGIWETGRDAVKLASSGFIIPFIFAYNTELLLAGAPLDIVIAIITGVIGCIVLAIVLNGWFFINISVITRLLLFPCAILLIVSQPMWISFLGLALTVLILTAEYLLRRHKQKSA